MRKVIHYNLIFPLFITIFLPPFVIIPIIGNFLIDSMVYYLSLRQTDSIPPFKQLMKLVIPAWLLGFVADIVGVAFILLITETLPRLDVIRIWNSLPTVLVVILTIFLVGLLIYFVNRWLLSRQGYDPEICHFTALAMGIITAPWFYLIPTSWFQSLMGNL